MQTKIIKDESGVDQRLAQLGLSKPLLLEIAAAMIGAKAGSTSNDPPGAPGWLSWQQGTRRSRELLQGDGWKKDETDQISSVISPDGIRLIVMNTDDGTGRADAAPQNCSKKGSGTDRVVSGNQGSFIESLEATLPISNVVELAPKREYARRYMTYYLCVFNDGNQVRIELACPSRVDQGFFVEFAERVILVGPGDTMERLYGQVPIEPEDEISVDVTRK